jgi:hypothetical protein
VQSRKAVSHASFYSLTKHQFEDEESISSDHPRRALRVGSFEQSDINLEAWQGSNQNRSGLSKTK